MIAATSTIALLGNTLSQFSRSRPSTGSFVTFVGGTFGGYSAVVTAVVLGVGYIIAVASVVTISGGLAETILQHYLSITIPWQAISAALLIQHSGHINGLPFDPSHLHRGFSGLSLGFPLAIYLFVGWENSAALAEEHRDPRRGVTRAVFSSVAVLGAVYVFLSYATVVGFDDNAKALTAASVPFITAAGGVARQSFSVVKHLVLPLVGPRRSPIRCMS